MTRDEKGRFIKGISGNPKGRPARDIEENYRAIMLDAVSPEDWRTIVLKAVDQAKRGNGLARKWLADYIIGLPVQRTEHSGPEGDALRIVFEYADDENGKADRPDDAG
jgi:hypothetical protein